MSNLALVYLSRAAVEGMDPKWFSTVSAGVWACALPRTCGCVGARVRGCAGAQVRGCARGVVCVVVCVCLCVYIYIYMWDLQGLCGNFWFFQGSAAQTASFTVF